MSHLPRKRKFELIEHLRTDNIAHEALCNNADVWTGLREFLWAKDLIRLSAVSSAWRKHNVIRGKVIVPYLQLGENDGFERVPSAFSHVLESVHLPSVKWLKIRLDGSYDPARQARLDDAHTASFPFFALRVLEFQALESLFFDAGGIYDHMQDGRLDVCLGLFESNLARLPNLRVLRVQCRSRDSRIRGHQPNALLNATAKTIRQNKLSHLDLWGSPEGGSIQDLAEALTGAHRLELLSLVMPNNWYENDLANALIKANAKDQSLNLENIRALKICLLRQRGNVSTNPQNISWQPFSEVLCFVGNSSNLEGALIITPPPNATNEGSAVEYVRMLRHFIAVCGKLRRLCIKFSNKCEDSRVGDYLADLAVQDCRWDRITTKNVAYSAQKIRMLHNFFKNQGMIQRPKSYEQESNGRFFIMDDACRLFVCKNRDFKSVRF